MLRLLWFSAVATVIVTACDDCDLCDTEMCNRVGQKLSDSINFRIRPCDNFHEHACGSRVQQRTIVNGLKPGSTESKDAAEFMDILNDRLYVTNSTKSLEIERKIYESCKMYGVRDEKARQKYYYQLPNGAKNLEHLPSQNDDTSEHWISSDLMFANNGYGFAFFDFKIVETFDPFRLTIRYIQISPPKDNILEINSLFAKKYDTQSGAGQPTNKAARELKNFLNELNKINNQYGSIVDESNMNRSNLRKISDWDKAWNDKVNRRASATFEWEKTIKSFFNSHGVSHVPSGNDDMIVLGEEYFLNNLIDLLGSTSVVTIENYINLRFISKTIGLVDPDYVDYSLIPSITGLSCLPGLFVGTAHAYARKHFPKDNQNKLKEVFEEVRKNIITHLGTMDTDDATRAFIRKLSNATVMYGYPDWLLDERLVGNFYADKMAVNEYYFMNEESVYVSVLKHNLNAYRSYSNPIIDINQFFKAITSDKIEIFEKNSNEIVLPVRFFSEKNLEFFSSLLFDPMNYGSAGVILATEIYEKWLDTVAVNSNNFTDCMRNFVPRNFDLSQKETYLFGRRATAYLLGLRTAYEAWPNKDSYPIMFPRHGALYDERLFFLSFAETLCDAKENNQLKNFDIPIDPTEFINPVVSNMKEFSKTFVCAESRGMNPKTKCDPLHENDVNELNYA